MKTKINTHSLTLAAIGCIVSGGIFLGANAQEMHDQAASSHQSAIHSPYAGQETRDIKALSPSEIEGLRAGAGTPFGGMAKPAELNGFPGPRHLLDAVTAGQISISATQKQQIETLYEQMRTDAIKLGTQILAVETALDQKFVNEDITRELLAEDVTKSAALYGQLRLVHLQAHLTMVEILSSQQVEQYNALRGYSSSDPCQQVPPGHDPKMWKHHNHCAKD
jgi:hypothetical protein